MDSAVKRSYVSDLQERVFRELFVAGERGCTTRALCEAVYAHCPDGGALAAEQCVRKAVHLLRHKLVQHGATIEADWGPGSSYRLVMLV